MLDNPCLPAEAFRKRRSGKHLGHDQNTVHRGADLMADSGDELGLRPAGLFRDQPCLVQFAGAGLDLVLQILLIVEELQIPVLELRNHLVEGGR